MSRTITALFDTRTDAEAGRERLLAADVDADNLHIHDKDSAGFAADTSETSTDMSTRTAVASMNAAHQDTGLWSSIKNALLPDEDRHVYEEGIRRGGFLLTADVDGDDIDEAIVALEGVNGVDIDARAAGWRSEGWTPPTKPAFFGNDRTDRNDDDASIPIVEEQLVVGKREVERGGMRLRSYVTETPVHEQVRLRTERVELERRPVDLEVGDADAFQERTIEMTETGEEAVVGKTARVVEEVSLRKTADERVEDIDDTVRKTEVEVENLAGESTGTGYGTTDRDGFNKPFDRN